MARFRFGRTVVTRLLLINVAMWMVNVAMAQTIGTGDGRIHVIPTLSAPSVKNGGTLTIQAVVKAEAGVARVEAEIEGVETIELKSEALSTAGVDLGTKIGLFKAEWKARGLKEKVYPVTLRVTDLKGHTHVDRTLKFSDPVAGNSVPGTTSYPDGGMRQVGSITASPSDEFYKVAAIDSAGGYAYLMTTYTGRIAKVRLSDFTFVAGLKLEIADSNQPACAVVDSVAGYLYVGFIWPSIVYKVRLSDFTWVDSLTLGPGSEGTLECAAFDQVAGFIYFGTGWGYVVKVRLSDFTRVNALLLDFDVSTLSSAVIDKEAGFAYFGTRTSPGRVLKMRLSDFSRAGMLTLPSGQNNLNNAAIDTAAGYAFFATGDTPGNLIRITLSSFTITGSLTLGQRGYVRNLFVDPVSGCLFLGMYDAPLTVNKVRESDLTSIGTLWAERAIDAAVFDPVSNFAYFALDYCPARLLKIGLSHQSFIHASQMQLSERSHILDVRFYSHTASGNLRLAIYDNASPRNLLWESGSVPNTAAEDWITVPVSSGAPNMLVVPEGTYWLAWQTDSSASTASYTAGTDGCGFVKTQPYGAYPCMINDSEIESTAEQWSQYVTYDLPPAAPGLPGANSITASQINWTWADQSTDETGFKVWADAGAGTPTTLRTTTAAGARSWLMSPLSANTQYAFQVAATSDHGDSAKTGNLSVYTGIEPIGSLVFSSVGTNSISVAAGNTFSNLTAGSSGLYFANSTAGTNNGWQQSNIAWASGGLSPNTAYTFAGKSRNCDAIENTAVNAVKYTSAAVPLAPVLSDPQLNSVKIAIAAGDGNPGSTTYAINCPSTGYWLQVDGSLGSSVPALTAAQWGTKTVTGLSSATNYEFRARAVNGEGYSTSFGPSSSVFTRFVLTYVAGANGSISGTASQAVTYGGTGSTVTAVGSPGYHFVQWSDGVMTASRADTNVTANKIVTATFSDQLMLAYTAGENGSIIGATPQLVTPGGSGTTVTAVAATGYHFQQWSDSRTDNPRVDTNVTSNVAVAAQFITNQYSLTYTAGAHGTISGTNPQTVAHGGNGTAVTAVPDSGYYFIHWSDGKVNATRTDINVVASKSVTAVFNDHMQYTLYYTCEPHGHLEGDTLQAVNYGATGTPVSAVPDPGFILMMWSDDLTGNPRTDYNVTTNRFPVAVFWADAYHRYVRFNYSGVENGQPEYPYNTVAEAVNAVGPGGHVMIYPGSTPSGVRITKQVRLEAIDGLVRIGR